MLLCRTSKLDLVTASTAFSLLDNYNPQYSRMAVSASGIYNSFRNLFLLQRRNPKLGASNVIFGGCRKLCGGKGVFPIMPGLCQSQGAESWRRMRSTVCSFLWTFRVQLSIFARSSHRDERRELPPLRSLRMAQTRPRTVTGIPL